MGDPCGKTYLRNAANDAWISVAVGSGTSGGGGSTTGDYIPEDGWVEIDDSLTYGSATTFTVTGDLTATFQKGTKLKFTQTKTKYFYVVSSAYVDPTTTVTITGGDDYSLANAAIDTPYYSYVEIPAGFPDWFNYTPTITGGGSLTISSPVINVAKFCIKGRAVYVIASATFATGGTANSSLYFTAPVASGTSSGYLGYGSGVYYVGANYYGAWCSVQYATPPEILIRRYDSSNWTIGSGREACLSVFYEIG